MKWPKCKCLNLFGTSCDRVWRDRSLKNIMHSKTDSEATSVSASSTTRPSVSLFTAFRALPGLPRRREDHHSFHSTPGLSPMVSPPHSHSSVGRHALQSSSSRFSGSRKILRKSLNPWKEPHTMEEEGLLDMEEDHNNALPRRCYYLAFLLAFILLFFFFALVLWDQ